MGYVILDVSLISGPSFPENFFDLIKNHTLYLYQIKNRTTMVITYQYYYNKIKNNM